MISRNGSEREAVGSYPYANAGYYPYETGAKLKVPRANICRTRNERFRFRARRGTSRADPFCLIPYNEGSVPETNRKPMLKFPAKLLEQMGRGRERGGEEQRASLIAPPYTLLRALD